ncbi:DJ-1/PfpI family protein [Candidatus Bipolaricaulota bacterium]|nr:DJ-1/PfpI family protein [Candidatus Bipolaricaulota bacterium]
MATKSQKTDQPVQMLLLVGDKIGANCLAGGKKLSILEKFHRYGWDLTIAGTNKQVDPCPFAAQRGMETPTIDCLVGDITDINDFDAVSVLPGPSHTGLIESAHALFLLRQAVNEGLVVSAWCRGVRVLAAADVVGGRQIVGHEDDKEFIEQARGIFIGQDHPPVTDGNLVTSARSYYYRAKNADAIKKAVQARHEQ